MQNAEIETSVSKSLTCENPKVLEVIMEHIVLQWDDIVELLFEELLHEEVQELNKIDLKKQQHIFKGPPTAARSTELEYLDKMNKSVTGNKAL